MRRLVPVISLLFSAGCVEDKSSESDDGAATSEDGGDGGGEDGEDGDGEDDDGDEEPEPYPSMIDCTYTRHADLEDDGVDDFWLSYAFIGGTADPEAALEVHHTNQSPAFAYDRERTIAYDEHDCIVSVRDVITRDGVTETWTATGECDSFGNGVFWEELIDTGDGPELVDREERTITYDADGNWTSSAEVTTSGDGSVAYSYIEAEWEDGHIVSLVTYLGAERMEETLEFRTYDGEKILLSETYLGEYYADYEGLLLEWRTYEYDERGLLTAEYYDRYDGYASFERQEYDVWERVALLQRYSLNTDDDFVWTPEYDAGISRHIRSTRQDNLDPDASWTVDWTYGGDWPVSWTETGVYNYADGVRHVVYDERSCGDEPAASVPPRPEAGMLRSRGGLVGLDGASRRGVSAALSELAR